MSPARLASLAFVLASLSQPALAQVLTPSAGQAAPAPSEPKVTSTQIERKGRTGFDITLGTYLTLDKECKIGPLPRLEITGEPKGGKIRQHPGAINLREVPGAPRRNCIGTSPNGMVIVYRAERRFKGEETIAFRLHYPNGDIREVNARVLVQ